MKKLFFLFFILFIRINSTIKENPIFLTDWIVPFLLTTNDNNYFYVITQEKSLKINKESGNIESTSNNTFNLLAYIYIVDESNNKYLYSLDSKIYYLINYNQFVSYSQNILPQVNDYPDDIIKVGSLSSQNNIIYGYSNNERSLIFLTFPQNYAYNLRIDYVINQLSCKLIENQVFICIIIPENLNYY